MISIEQLSFRLNSGIGLTNAEQSLILREMLRQLAELKEAFNEHTKLPTLKPRVDPVTEGTLPAPTVRRKNDIG